MKFDSIVSVEIQRSDDSNEINLLITTNNRDKFVFEGEQDLLEDSLFIKKYITDKVRFIENSNRDLKFSSISEYYYAKGDIQQESFTSPDELKKSSQPKKSPKQPEATDKPKLKKPSKLFRKND